MPGAPVEIKARLTAEDIATVQALIEAVARADGIQPLGDQKWLDLIHGGAPGFSGLLLSDEGRLVGYGQLSGDDGVWGLETLVNPNRRNRSSVLEALLQAALGEVARRGGGELRYWLKRPADDEDRLVGTLGFESWRNLLQLRVPLPLPSDVRAKSAPVVLRAFRVGVDEVAWLTMNNRAFAKHPEQGGWSLTTLLGREEEPWFDPEGFLIYEENGTVAGACWTKVHEAHDPALGEIYVIAVDPLAHGRGLGRALTTRGLDWLAGRGLRVGMLYVDESNTVAVALYESIGFTVDHVDRAYRQQVSASR